MVHQLTEANGERTNRGRHQDIGTRGGLGATLQRAIVQGAHLIGMVREVSIGAGVIKRELTADQQGTLMMAGTEGTAEGSTGLTIRHERVGKKQARLGGKAIRDLTGLTHETVLHLHGVVDRATVTNDRILTDHTRTDKHRGIHRAHHRTLGETGSTANLAVPLDDRVRDILGIDDLHVITDIATLRT